MRFVIRDTHTKIQDLAEVFDTKTKRGMGLYSSYRDGSDYREQAETQCNALNRAQSPNVLSH